MPLDAVEFLRRFFLHVLPKGFVRIRHYGLLSNRFRKQLLPLARTLLPAQGHEQLPLPPLPNSELWHCPVAAHPCASPSASPPHNSISQASIPHDRLPQSALHACSTHASAAVCPQDPAKLQNRLHRRPGTA